MYFMIKAQKKNSFRSEIIGYPYITKLLQNEDNEKVVVDLGCGIGKLTYAIAKLGFREVKGIDKDVKHIELAQKKYILPNTTYEVVKLPKVVSGDVAVMAFVAMYLDDNVLIQTLQNVKKQGFQKIIILDIHPVLPILQPNTKWEEWITKKDEINYFKTSQVEQYIFPADKKIYAKWYVRPFEIWFNIFRKSGWICKNIMEPKLKNKVVDFKDRFIDEDKQPFYVVFVLENAN